MPRDVFIRYSILLLLLTSAFAVDSGQRGYFRYPAIHGEIIVFTAEGDLWKVASNGGTAQRLTSHSAEESRAAISPDGSTIAFSASYEGPTEVYVMPIAGGNPKRITFEGSGAQVVGWTPAGLVLYATRHYSTLPNTQLSTVDPKTGATALLGLAQASDGCYDAAGKTLYFTRLPFQGSHTRRYKGGTAQNLWKWPAGAPEAVPITPDYPGTSKTPMFWNGRIYFASDRDGVMNIWSSDDTGRDLRQHTRHTDYEVQFPSLSNGRIAYQHGADLLLLDIRSGRSTLLDIRLASDFDQMRERWVKKPIDYLTSAHVSADGDRVALTARGQLFIAPAGQGRLVETTRKARVRYRDARFMPDGKSLIALSDESGEIELWKLPANGVGPAEQLTSDGQILRWEAVPSPDGKWIAHHDKNQKLWLYDTQKKAGQLIATSAEGPFSNLRWSPDSRWLAFTQDDPDSTLSRIRIYNLETKSLTDATTGRYDSFSPVWSPDGSWLYFLSNREFQSAVGSPWGSRQPEPYFDRQTKIYQLALRRGLRSPFRAKDELQTESAAAKESGKSDKEKKEGTTAVTPVEIELAALADRLIELPVTAGNYNNLTHDGKRLYWMKFDSSVGGKTTLETLEIKNEEPKAETYLEDIRSYEMSQDGKKLMVRKGNDLYVLPVGAKAPTNMTSNRVDLSGWTFSMDPREEWHQMFVEAWRLERDYFYDPGMHGLNWPAIRDKYAPLAERVTDRSELNDVLTQMVAELSALHIFVRGGDLREGPDSIEPASLGARLRRDETAGGYRVEHVYASDPDIPDELAPLAKPGVEVKEGDLIESINGTPLLTVADPAIPLRNQAGKQVLLRVKAAAGGNSRDVVVVPISQGRESDLRYDEWEFTRRALVDRLSDNQIGYVHLRAMGGSNIAEWTREFYPVFKRKGLIIDVRHNNGGNIDSWILGRLLRRAWFYWQPRVGNPSWNMQYAFRGPMVVLVNERTASDGEAFAEGFRRLGLGKVIGTRTWGGEIWLSSSNFLADRGIATAAETGVFGPEGEWLIEGHGVDPDIVVDNPPRATFEGKDNQLEAAVKHLQEEIRKKPVEVPKAPLYPKKQV